MNQFTTRGAVPLGARYVRRAYEDELFSKVTSGEWVLLEGPHQQGKSSAIIRLRSDLGAEGIPCARVDLQSVQPTDDYAGWLGKVFGRLAEDMGGRRPGPEGDLELQVRSLLGTDPRSVIIFDECGRVPAAFMNAFYGQLRALFNRKAELVFGEDAVAGLSCLFAGTFRHDRAIDANQSPFNVIEPVSATDFSLAEVIELAGESLADWAEPTFNHLGGQPRLTQVVFRHLEGGSMEGRGQRFAEALARIESGDDDHYTKLFGRVAADERLVDIVSEMVTSGGSIPYSGMDAEHRWLVVVGIARRVGGQLTFRSRVLKRQALADPRFNRLRRVVLDTMALVMQGVEPSTERLDELAQLLEQTQQGIDDMKDMMGDVWARSKSQGAQGRVKKFIEGLPEKAVWEALKTAGKAAIGAAWGAIQTGAV